MEKLGPKPAEVLFPGRVTQVIDPQYFWMQMGSADQVACFLKIQSDMQQYCEGHWSSTSDADNLAIGQLVLVDTGQSDIRWRRGQVTRISSESADIFYIDYGNTELAKLDSICVEFPPIIRSVPPMAMRCCLAGVQPIARSWTTRGIKTFTKLTTGYTLQTLVMFADIGTLYVSLYGRESGNPRSIAHQLLDEDVAVPVENNEVPEYVSEIPAFLALLATQSESSTVPGNERNGKDPNHNNTKEAALSPPKTSEKYIPPARKQSGSSPGSATRNGPVHDFFPFENVSTYPPTPTESPTKASSVGKGSSPGSSEGSYFSRSPGRDYFQQDYDRMDQNYGSPGKNENGYRRDINSNSNYYDRSPQKAFQVSLSPRSYSNYEQAPGPPGLGSSTGITKNSDHTSSPRSSSSMSGSGTTVNKLLNGNVHTFIPPFFQPKKPYTNVTQMNFTKPANQTPLTPPTAYEHHTSVESHHFDPALTPPGYYESQKTSSNDYNHRHSYDSYTSNYQNQCYSGNYNNSSMGSGTNSFEKQYAGSYPNSYNSKKEYKDSDRDKYKEGPARVNRSPNSSSYAEEKTKGNPSVRLQIPDMPFAPSSSPAKSPGSYYSSNAASIPSKSPGSYYSTKTSQLSPESPAIANFDMNDIEHTMDVSTIGLHQRSHQQTLMALQEEAEDIARESQEQMQLHKMSRLGRSVSENYVEDYIETGAPDIFDRISEEIRDASSKENMQFYEDMKRSPVKRRLPSDSYQRPPEPDKPSKLEEMPQSYLADIDFSVAVKEALESSKTEGMENTQALLEEIVESLKAARVEKQLYDVIILLLATAIEDYNLYHVVVMDTISKLNGEFDIKDTLAKALKKQQDMHVRVPLPKKEKHSDFSQVMGHIYNMSMDWRDSNSSIQESILNTIERWIVFNNKGSQIGQTDKENVFLDCFMAFWEISNNQLRKHNHAFYMRLQDEVKKKLLNDNVTRTIKERLLNILLEMFSVVESRPSIDMFTQTPRRTMIPSSCQVKPFTCDKGTMTLEVDQVYYDIISSPENRFHSTNESVTPEISLRPAKSWAQEYHSTPHDEHNHYSGDKRHFDASLRAPSASQYSENSYMESSYSVYETPNESFADRSVSVDMGTSLDSNMLKSQNIEKSARENGMIQQQKDIADHKPDKIGKSKSWASVASDSKIKEAEVKDSSAKASIVDWFEYNPEPEPAVKETVIDKKQTSKKSNKSKSNKSGSSLTDIAKDFVSHARVKSDIVSSCQETDISQSKHNQDIKDMKIRHDSPKHHESVAEKLAKKSELDRLQELTKHDEKTKTESLDKQNLVNTTMGNTGASVKKDNIPDVGQDYETVSDKETVINEKLDWWEDSEQVKTGNTDIEEVLIPPEERINVNRHDEFGFQDEFDYDDEHWETHSDAECDNGSQRPVNYDIDFPETDLHEPVRLPSDYGASSEVVNNDSNRDFPNIDLASFIDVPQPDVQEPAPRWRPGVRRCTLCGDQSHTANDCPDSASKLFL